MSSDLVELQEDLDGELWDDGPTGDLVGEVGANGGPPVQLEGGHPLHATPRLSSVRTHRRELHVHVVSDKLADKAVVMARMIRVTHTQETGSRIGHLSSSSHDEKLRLARHSIPRHK